jgi:hypothetical protein
MEQLERPSVEVWNRHRGWLESQVSEYEERTSYFVCEQACALTTEVNLANVQAHGWQ